MFDEFLITIIGGGVVGLAIAAELSQYYHNVLLVEKNDTFGLETSSRNSEVIHAGIHYPPHFLKTILCVTGKYLLYELCEQKGIPYNKMGKLIVATSDEEEEHLQKLKDEAAEKGVGDLVLLTQKEIKLREPGVKGKAALFSPSTGIIDSHKLMRFFLSQAEERGAIVSFRSEVTGIERRNSNYLVEINKGEYRFFSRIVVNSSGLQADRIAAFTGLDVNKLGLRIRYCKGNYFSLSGMRRFNHLIYPVAKGEKEGLGIHVTIDLGGRVRLGPDVEYVDSIDYAVDERKKGHFYQAVKVFLPEIKIDHLNPDMSGIRPKLYGPGEKVRDFVIRDEKENGYPGFINLVGIESPGLTSCMAIGKYVASIVNEILN